jgi:hypothetical protein
MQFEGHDINRAVPLISGNYHHRSNIQKRETEWGSSPTALRVDFASWTSFVHLFFHPLRRESESRAAHVHI